MYDGLYVLSYLASCPMIVGVAFSLFNLRFVDKIVGCIVACGRVVADVVADLVACIVCCECMRNCCGEVLRNSATGFFLVGNML